jgi:PAS domain S-box-containing protein
MLNLLLLVADLWVVGGAVFGLHYLNPRYGFAPLLLAVGGLAAILQLQSGVYIEPFPQFLLFIASNVLVPVVLAAVLAVYVVNGSAPAPTLIVSVLAVSVLALGVYTLYGAHLSLPAGGTFGFTAEAVTPRVRVTLASLIAFAADMFAIAVVYQGARNHVHWMPEWGSPGLALLAALWTDSIVFSLLATGGTTRFVTDLPGDVLGKTLSALVLWPLVALYLTRFAPRMPGYVGGLGRRTLDVFQGSFDEVKLALIRTEAALEQSEAERRRVQTYLEQISSNISEALWLAEPGKTHPVYTNIAYERIWGRSAESILGDPRAFVDSIHPEDRDRVLAGLPRQSSGHYSVDYRVVRPDGTVRWVRDRAFPIINEQGQVTRIAGITEDITERRVLERNQLDLAVEREKVKLLRDFISEASHDIKGPLTAFNLLVHQLSRAEDEEKRQIYLQDLQIISGRLGKTIEDLLTLSRLESKGEMEAMKLNLNQMLREICDGLSPICEQKKLEVVLRPVPLEAVVRADRVDLARALSNLVENAMNYTPPGGRVEVGAQVDEREVLISVRDTGIGIPADEQPMIFDRFFRATNARSADPAGTGLGLAIVKRVVEQHRGRIDVQSAIGIGTTFNVYLPRADGQRAN